MNEAELASIVWRAPEWITALGGLRPNNVLEYFSQSPFFDRRSNNAVLKMQSQFQNFGNVNEALRKMRGIEFTVAQQTPPDLFVINKQQRESYDQVSILKVYFIINGNIYLAPNAYSIINSRVLYINQSLTAAIDALKDSVQFSTTKGYTYADASDVTAVASDEKSKEEEPETELDKTVQLVESRSMQKALFNTISRMT